MDEQITKGELEIRIEKVYGDPATEIQTAEILRRCSLLRNELLAELQRTDPRAIVTCQDLHTYAHFEMTCSHIEAETLLRLVRDHVESQELVDRMTKLVTH